MTEDEAREKWCPMVRHIMDLEGNFHTTNGRKAEGFQNCTASDCMMWRPGALGQWQLPNGEPVPIPLPTDARVPEDIGAIWVVTDGYCGLAGKP